MARLCLLLLSALLLTARAAAGEQAVLVADYLYETGPRDAPGYESFQATFWGDASVLLVACRGRGRRIAPSGSPAPIPRGSPPSARRCGQQGSTRDRRCRCAAPRATARWARAMP